MAVNTLTRSNARLAAQMGGDTIELPAGLMDPGEDAATAALRELKEETGYTAQVGPHDAMWSRAA